MKTRTIIYAEKDHVLTNGEIYGKQIFLADGENSEGYYEITEEEYAELMRKKELEEETI